MWWRETTDAGSFCDWVEASNALQDVLVEIYQNNWNLFCVGCLCPVQLLEDSRQCHPRRRAYKVVHRCKSSSLENLRRKSSLWYCNQNPRLPAQNWDCKTLRPLPIPCSEVQAHHIGLEDSLVQKLNRATCRHLYCSASGKLIPAARQ